MEVNGRHNRSALLAVHCGINFPWLQYQHLVQGKLPSAGKYPNGVYWIDITKDVVFSARYWKMEPHSLGDYAQPYLKPHVFSVFDTRDLKPFLKQCTDLVLRAAGVDSSAAKAQRAQGSEVGGTV
jgi:D-aspartate ligase